MKPHLAFLFAAAMLTTFGAVPEPINGVRYGTDTTGTNTSSSNVTIPNSESRTRLRARNLEATNSVKVISLTPSMVAGIGADNTITNTLVAITNLTAIVNGGGTLTNAAAIYVTNLYVTNLYVTNITFNSTVITNIVQDTNNWVNVNTKSSQLPGVAFIGDSPSGDFSTWFTAQTGQDPAAPISTLVLVRTNYNNLYFSAETADGLDYGFFNVTADATSPQAHMYLRADSSPTNHQTVMQFDAFPDSITWSASLHGSTPIYIQVQTNGFNQFYFSAENGATPNYGYVAFATEDDASPYATVQIQSNDGGAASYWSLQAVPDDLNIFGIQRGSQVLKFQPASTINPAFFFRSIYNMGSGVKLFEVQDYLGNTIFAVDAESGWDGDSGKYYGADGKVHLLGGSGGTTNYFSTIFVTNLTVIEEISTKIHTNTYVTINTNIYVTNGGAIFLNGTNVATINPTDGAIPIRSGTNSFADLAIGNWLTNAAGTLKGAILPGSNVTFTTNNGAVTLASQPPAGSLIGPLTDTYILMANGTTNVASSPMYVPATNTVQMGSASANIQVLIGDSTTNHIRFLANSAVSEIVFFNDGATELTYFRPNVSAVSPAYILDTSQTHTEGDLLRVANFGATKFAVTATNSLMNGTTIGWYHGTGDPNSGALTNAAKGSFYSREDGGAGTSFYVKENAGANWVGK